MRIAALALVIAGCGSAAAPDAAIDAGTDAGVDAGTDAGADAGTDAGTDAGIDAGTDAGRSRARAPSPPDERALATTLREGEIVLVERGHGGRSLGFRLTFADGTRGYFKPEQTFSGMHWYAEIAAYHLDRALGLRRTPVVVGRRLAWSLLESAAGDDARVAEIVVGEDGTVRGALVAWIEERLVPLRPPEGWEVVLRDEPPAAVTPFQSPRGWYRATAHDASVLDAGVPDAATPELDSPGRAAELSDLVLFDYLVHNPDRWSANSTNVRTRGEGGPLVFLDQGAGFTPRRARLALMDARLAQVQRFRRSTVDAIRTLDLDALVASLDRDPLAPILEPRQLEHLAARREALLAHVDAVVTAHGERAYAW